jgi:hypothetical protein
VDSFAGSSPGLLPVYLLVASSISAGLMNGAADCSRLVYLIEIESSKMSTPPPTQPPPLNPAPLDPPQPPIQAEIEYRSLVEYFKDLVKYTYAAIGLFLALVLGVAVFFSVRTLSDIKNQASEMAKTEARKSIEEALNNRPELQKAIDDAVKQRVVPAVDAEITKTMGERVRALETELKEYANMATLAAQVKSGDSRALHQMIKQMYENPNQKLRALAQQTL